MIGKMHPIATTERRKFFAPAVVTAFSGQSKKSPYKSLK